LVILEEPYITILVGGVVGMTMSTTKVGGEESSSILSFSKEKALERLKDISSSIVITSLITKGLFLLEEPKMEEKKP